MGKMKRKEYESGQEEIRKDYFRKLEAKQNNEPWVQEIPVDMTSERAIHEKCLICGNPNMKEQLSGSECKRCGINRLIETYGYTKESAEAEYEDRKNRKQASLTFYEMARKKKVSKTKRDDTQDLGF
jgi:hypothetical protein